MKPFYTLGIRLYAFGIRIASLWNPKAKKWIKGRTNWEAQFKNYSAQKDTYWFHCASLGEFEQGLPVMELLKARGGDIVVSFFSPSGFEAKKDHPISDYIFYLPIDTKKNAEKILGIIQPKAIVFVKYEFWANLILTARDKGVELSLIVGLFRKDQIFFKSYGGFMRKVLHSFKNIFVQNSSSQELLKGIKIESENLGDTRFDRVHSNLSDPKSYPKIENFISDKKVLVLGSVWKEDLEIIAESINELNADWKILVAPHNVDGQTVREICTYLKKPTIYLEEDQIESNIMIVNTIGMLQHLYHYGDIAYVGGGFKTGLHNILEPAVFGLPVIFGDQVQKFPEAELFINAGIGYKISNKSDFDAAFEKSKANQKTEVSAFIQNNLGASEKIANKI